jgi:hypothetical protein
LGEFFVIALICFFSGFGSVLSLFELFCLLGSLVRVILYALFWFVVFML